MFGQQDTGCLSASAIAGCRIVGIAVRTAGITSAADGIATATAFPTATNIVPKTARWATAIPTVSPTHTKILQTPPTAASETAARLDGSGAPWAPRPFFANLPELSGGSQCRSDQTVSVFPSPS